VSLIVTRHLAKAYPSGRGASRAAVADATFEVGANEILAVMGPNGAGKTTLVDLLATVLAPTSGSLQVVDLDAVSDPQRVRRHVGYVPSGSRSLYGRLTGRQNLRFFAALHGICGNAAAARVDAALTLWGAWPVAEVRADRMSDGMACRVALARAVLHDPLVLLLDESTRSIDPMSRPEVLQAIRRYVDRSGKCAVLVTHDVSDVHEICDRVAMMRDGAIERIVPADSLPRDGRVAAGVKGR